MSPEQLDAIRARAEAATEGPWGSATTDSGFAVHRGAHYTVALYLSRLDAEFIAHAREDVPALLVELGDCGPTATRRAGSCPPWTSSPESAPCPTTRY